MLEWTEHRARIRALGSGLGSEVAVSSLHPEQTAQVAPHPFQVPNPTVTLLTAHAGPSAQMDVWGREVEGVWLPRVIQPES